jgi:flagellin
MSTNAYRQLGMNNASVAKSLEKLSSGFRINRAGDDASGLAISEKMKSQIKGLEQAAANAQDGISLVQTAEGALTEVHSMLNRMVELATKSANGTIQNEVDRESIQTEVDALKEEISRIAKSTNFNGIQLLDGSLGKPSSAVVSAATVNGANAAITTVPAAASTYTTDDVAAGTDGGSQTLTISYTDAAGKSKSVEISYTSSDVAGDNRDAIMGAINGNSELSALFTATADGDAMVVSSKLTGTNAPTITDIATDDTATGLQADLTGKTPVKGAAAYNTVDLNNLKVGDSLTINGKTYEFVANAGDKTTTSGATGVVFTTDAAGSAAALNAALGEAGIVAANTSGTTYKFTVDPDAEGKGLVLQVGTTNDDFNKVTVKVDDLSASGLGLDALNVSTAETAGEAINVINTAINKVSTNRGNLGALQNRLEYAINNLDTTSENMNAANSRIRDTDMAKEMMNYTKMNILTQAAQAMLAQANQQPQSILQLLQ